MSEICRIIVAMSTELREQWEQLYLPLRPLCTNDFIEGVYRQPRAKALEGYRYIEANPKTVSDLLVVDVDDANARAMALWEHEGMLPNVIVENPRNGHAHAVWALAAPFSRTEYARRKPLALAAAVTEGLRRSCDGDKGYSGLMTKNPLHEAWNSELVTDHLYGLDERGERVPLIDPETGRQKTDKRGRRQWKRTSVSLNPLDRKAKLKALRESWAKTCNARLDETARIDHRSLEDQGSDLEPTIHEGYAARAIERAGGVSERCEANREIRRSNGLLTAIRTELGRIFDRLGELFAAKIRQLRQRQARPEPAREPNWRYFEGDARRQLEADRADHTAAIRGKLMGAKADVRNREEWWRSHGTEEFEAAKQIIDVARAASREARDANVFKRGRLLRNAEQVAGEQSEKLRGAVPWLEDTDIPSDWDQANRFRMRATKAIHDHDMQPRTGLVDELERRLEQAERAEGEKPSPEQVKALALRMAEQRERAAEDPTQDMNRPEPSGDEPLDLSEPEDLGESGPFEERSAPRTKADLLREIRQRADRRTGQQEAEQRQIDPWQAQPPQRRGHGR